MKTDYTTNKVTVTGKVDPTEIKEKLEQKIKKKVELVSPQPKKDGGGDKKPAEKAEKKEEPKKEEPKKPIQVCTRGGVIQTYTNQIGGLSQWFITGLLSLFVPFVTHEAIYLFNLISIFFN